MTVNRATVSNTGLYICDAINKYGGERDNVTIKVLPAPKVHVVPENLTLREGEEAIFECLVEGDEGRKIAYNWVGPDGDLIENVRKFRSTQQFGFSISFQGKFSSLSNACKSWSPWEDSDV